MIYLPLLDKTYFMHIVGTSQKSPKRWKRMLASLCYKPSPTAWFVCYLYKFNQSTWHGNSLHWFTSIFLAPIFKLIFITDGFQFPENSSLYGFVFQYPISLIGSVYLRISPEYSRIFSNISDWYSDLDSGASLSVWILMCVLAVDHSLKRLHIIESPFVVPEDIILHLLQYHRSLWSLLQRHQWSNSFRNDCYFQAETPLSIHKSFGDILETQLNSHESKWQTGTQLPLAVHKIEWATPNLYLVRVPLPLSQHPLLNPQGERIV